MKMLNPQNLINVRCAVVGPPPLHGGLCESFRVFMQGMLQNNGN